MIESTLTANCQALVHAHEKTLTLDSTTPTLAPVVVSTAFAAKSDKSSTSRIKDRNVTSQKLQMIRRDIRGHESFVVMTPAPLQIPNPR